MDFGFWILDYRTARNRKYFAALAVLIMLCGCGRKAAPGGADVPALPASFHAPAFMDCNPKWSNDGSRIAFLRATPDRKLQLFLANGDLTNAAALLPPEIVNPDRPYSPGLRRYNSPDTLAWSPDDRWIAYERNEWFQFDTAAHDRLPGTGLWLLDLTTRQSRPLAVHSRRYNDNLYYYHYPRWSPDGERIAFTGEGVNGQKAIFTRNFDFDSEARNTQPNPRFDKFQDSDWPAWNPKAEDAPMLAYRQGVRRAPTTPKTETLRVLQFGTEGGGASTERGRIKPAGRGEPRIGNLVWSPDGRQIACTLTDDAANFSHYKIAVADEKGVLRSVSPANGNGYFAPVWIDNHTLGALAAADGTDFAVVTMDIAGGKTQRYGMISSADCDWSPDRKRIVYAVPPPQTAPPSASPSLTTLRIFALRNNEK